MGDKKSGHWNREDDALCKGTVVLAGTWMLSSLSVAVGDIYISHKPVSLHIRPRDWLS